MARRVAWTGAALIDLETAASYIAEYSARYAAAFVREARDAARSLARLAERGRVVPEFKDPSVRELFVRNFRLIYRVSEDTVHIIGFIHGARDLQRLREREGKQSLE